MWFNSNLDWVDKVGQICYSWFPFDEYMLMICDYVFQVLINAVSDDPVQKFWWFELPNHENCRCLICSLYWKLDGQKTISLSEGTSAFSSDDFNRWKLVCSTIVGIFLKKCVIYRQVPLQDLMVIRLNTATTLLTWGTYTDSKRFKTGERFR